MFSKAIKCHVNLFNKFWGTECTALVLGSSSTLQIYAYFIFSNWYWIIPQNTSLWYSFVALYTICSKNYSLYSLRSKLACKKYLLDCFRLHFVNKSLLNGTFIWILEEGIPLNQVQYHTKKELLLWWDITMECPTSSRTVLRSKLVDWAYGFNSRSLCRPSHSMFIVVYSETCVNAG